MNDPASLDNLRDIAQPEAVSMWPSAPGWWVVLACVTVMVAVVVYRQTKLWLVNRYRRDALRELQTADGDRAIAEILKRTALAAFPRSDVASLSGEAWCRWLSDTSGLKIEPAIEQSLAISRFQSNAGRTKGLQDFAEAWIQRHRRTENC